MYVGLLVITVSLFAVVCVYFAHSPAACFFHPLTVYLAFHGLVFVVRPVFAWFYQFTLIYDVYQFTPDTYAKNMALVAANVGLLSFAFASLRFGSAAFVNKFDAYTDREAVALARPLTIVAIMLLPLILYSTYLLWQSRSMAEFGGMVMDTATGTTINTQNVGYLQSGQLAGVTLVAIFAWVGRFRPWTLVPAAIFLLLRGGSGGRGPMIAMLVALACFYLYSRRRKFPDARALVLLVVGLMLFNFVGDDRGHRIRSWFTTDLAVEEAESNRKLAPLEGMDAGNLEFLEYLTDKIPRDTGTYDYFRDNLQLLTEPIPRILWKNKPIGAPIQPFNLFDYGFPIGMTRSLPGEGWYAFGLLGVAAWCGLWGGVLGWIYSAWAKSRQSVLQTSLYFSLIAMLTVFYRDGMLITMAKQALFYMLPALLWHWLAKAMGVPRQAEFRDMVLAAITRRGRRDQGALDEAAVSSAPNAALAVSHVGSAQSVTPPALPRSRRPRALRRALPHG